MKLKVFVDGTLMKGPHELRGMTFGQDLKHMIMDDKFTRDHEALTLMNSTDFTFTDPDDLAKINGVISAKGRFRGIPYYIEGGGQVLVKGFLNPSNPNFRWSCDEITIPTLKDDSQDWLDSVADGFGFDYLASDDVEIIQPSDYTQVPYVIDRIPNYEAAASAGIMAFILGNELVNTIKETAQIISDIAGLTNAGAGIGKIAVQVVYVTGLLIALVNLIDALVDSLIQPVKYHAGMYVLDLIEKGCLHLGLTFDSSIFNGTYNKLLFMPEKREVGPEGANVTDQLGHPSGTFGDFLRWIQTMFNGMYWFEGSKLRFERWDHNDLQGGYVLPAIRDREGLAYNTEEMFGRYRLAFAVDSLEKHTLDRYPGTVTVASTQVTPVPTTPAQRRNTLIQGSTDFNIPVARGYRKIEDTLPEAIIKVAVNLALPLFNVVVTGLNAAIAIANGAIAVFNGFVNALAFFGINIPFSASPLPYLQPVTLDDLFSDRIGMLVLNEDFTQVPKVFLFDDERLTANNVDVVHSEYLIENFHKINLFVPTATNPNANQWITYPKRLVQFTKADFAAMAGKPFQTDSDGNMVQFVEFEWNGYGDSATIAAAVNQLYEQNLLLVLTTDRTV